MAQLTRPDPLGKTTSDQAVNTLRGQQSIVTPHLVSGVGSFHDVNTDRINGRPVGYLSHYFRQATAPGETLLFSFAADLVKMGWDKINPPDLLLTSEVIQESSATDAPWTVTQSGVYMIDVHLRIAGSGGTPFTCKLNVVKNDTLVCDSVSGFSIGGPEVGTMGHLSCHLLLALDTADTLLFTLQTSPYNFTDTGVKTAEIRIVKIA